jgi:hypothetical protein
MGDRAELGMAVPQGATKVVVNAMAAGNLGLTFPLRLKVSVNGRESEHVVQQAGDFSFELPLKEGDKLAHVAVQSPQSVDIGERAIRYKVVKRSLLLKSLVFK